MPGLPDEIMNGANGQMIGAICHEAPLLSEYDGIIRWLQTQELEMIHSHSRKPKYIIFDKRGYGRRVGRITMQDNSRWKLYISRKEIDVFDVADEAMQAAAEHLGKSLYILPAMPSQAFTAKPTKS